jgi:formate hydrogenlyase subunit 4
MESFLLILSTSFFFSGIVNRTKSYASGRKGPGILQPIWDIFRLLRKGTVTSDTTSFIFQIGASVYFASMLLAIFILPVGQFRGFISFEGDFVFFAYVLGCGKFFLIISALDTGSSFEGMGANREALFSMLAEPAFFVLLGCLALLTSQTSFYNIFQALSFGPLVSIALGVMVTFVLTMLTMIENSRIPVDDPKTHLELTMVHEVMALDHSGFNLGLIQATSNLKFVLYGTLIVNLFITNQGLLPGIGIFFAIQFAFAVLVGFLESFTARFRMNHNAQFIFTLSSVSLLIFFGVLLVMGKFK